MWHFMPPRLSRLRILTFCLVFLLGIARAWDRVAHAELWGEDGRVFLAGVMNDGVSSLLQPMAGSFFLIERLIALVTWHLVPLAFIPTAIAFASVAVFAAVMSRIASPDYEWLMPSTTFRVALAFMCVLLPGLEEMAANLCNLNWFLFCWVALLGLKDPRTSLTRPELGLTLLISLSLGTAVLLLPLFAWRLWRAWADGNRQGRQSTAIALGILVVFGVALLMPVSGRPAASSGLAVTRVILVWMDHVVRFVGLVPWLGAQAMSRPLAPSIASWYRVGQGGLVLLTALWLWRYRRDAPVQATVLLVAGMSGWMVMAMLTRPYALAQLELGGTPPFFVTRYAFPMSFAGLLFWAVVLRPWTATRSQLSIMVVAFVALNVSLSLYRFRIPAYGEERRWDATRVALEQSIGSGCPHAVEVRQYPNRWRFVYTSPHPSPSCAP